MFLLGLLFSILWCSLALATETHKRTIIAVDPQFVEGTSITVTSTYNDDTGVCLGVPGVPTMPQILIQEEGGTAIDVAVYDQNNINWKILDAPDPSLIGTTFQKNPINYPKGLYKLEASEVSFYSYYKKRAYDFAPGVKKPTFNLQYNGPRIYAFRIWDTDINDPRARTIHALKMGDRIELDTPSKLEVKRNLQYHTTWNYIDASALRWKLTSQPAGGTIPLGTYATAFDINYPAGDYTYTLDIDSLALAYELTMLDKSKLPVIKIHYSGKEIEPSNYSVSTIPYDSTYAKQIISNHAYINPQYDTDFSVRSMYIDTMITNHTTGAKTKFYIPVKNWGKTSSGALNTYTPTLDDSVFYSFPIPESLTNSNDIKVLTVHLEPWIDHDIKSVQSETIKLGKPIDTKLSIPVNITFPTATPDYADFNNPYRDATVEYNLKNILYNGSPVSNISQVGSYTLTYEPKDITAKKMQVYPYTSPDPMYDGYVYFYKNRVPAGCNYPPEYTVNLTVVDGEFSQNTVTQIDSLPMATVMQVYRKDTITSATYATSIPTTLNVDYYRLTPTPPGYFREALGVQWFLGTTDLANFDLNAQPAGDYIFTAKFRDAAHQTMAFKSGVKMPTITIKLVEGDPSASLEKIAPQAWANPAQYGNAYAPIPAVYFVEEGKEYALIDPLDPSKTLEIDISWYNNVYNSMMMDNTGETAIELLTKVNGDGKTVVYGVKGKNAGSDFFFDGGNKIIWIYTIDTAMEQDPKFDILEEHDSDYFQNHFKHSLNIDKTATWLDQTINDALVTFDITGTSLNIPNNADIIMILDTSSSMNEKISNVPPTSSFYGKTYFEAAQVTLKSLAKLFMGKDETRVNNIRIALVAFGNDTHSSTNFVNNLEEFEKAVDSVRVYPNSTTGTTPAMIQAYAYLVSRKPEFQDRLPIMYFVTDGNPTMYYDQHKLYPGKQVFTMNYMFTENFIINELNTYYSIRKGLTTVKTPTTLLKEFDNTDDGFGSFDVGTTTYEDFINMVISPFVAATNTVLTDIIAKDWEFDDSRASTLMGKYPTTTIVNNDNSTQTVTVPLGNIEAGDTFKIEIPIRLKQSTIDAQVPEEVFYPTNKSPETPKAANITYKRFDFKHMEINDAGVVGDIKDMNNDNNGNPIATPELPWHIRVVPTPVPVPTPTSTPLPAPTTGDSTNVATWLVLLLLSIGAISGMMVAKKRKK